MKCQISITTFIFLVLFSACSGQTNSEAKKMASVGRSGVKDPSIENDVAKIAAEAKGKVASMPLTSERASIFPFTPMSATRCRASINSQYRWP
ncbi:MAG: hypothetical protein ABI878_12630 [Acidobacteriota bacterium]